MAAVTLIAVVLGASLQPVAIPAVGRPGKPRATQEEAAPAGATVTIRLPMLGARVELPEGWSAAGPGEHRTDLVRDATTRIAVTQQAATTCGGRIAAASKRGEAVERLPWAGTPRGARWFPSALRTGGGYLVCGLPDEDAKPGTQTDASFEITLAAGRALDAALLEVLEPLREAVVAAERVPDRLWFGGVEIGTAALRGSWFLYRNLMPRTLERDVAGGVVQVFPARRTAECADREARPDWVPETFHVIRLGSDDESTWLEVCTSIPGREATASYRVASTTFEPDDLAAARPLLEAIARDARLAEGGSPRVPTAPH